MLTNSRRGSPFSSTRTTNFFEEVAKFRCARRVWAHIMRDHFGAKNPRSWMLRFHTQTAGSTLTAQQPENNIVRTAIQALSAVLGGTQSLHTNGYDEALALPTEEAARIALRTQQILAYESGVAQTVDPLAGSYYVESLTSEIEPRFTNILTASNRWAACCAPSNAGWVQQEIQNAAYEYQCAVDRGRGGRRGCEPIRPRRATSPPSPSSASMKIWNAGRSSVSAPCACAGTRFQPMGDRAPQESPTMPVPVPT